MAHRSSAIISNGAPLHASANPSVGAPNSVCLHCHGVYASAIWRMHQCLHFLLCPLWQSLRLEVRHWRHRHIRPDTKRVVSSATYQTDGLSKCSSWLRQAFIFFLLVSRGLQRIRHLADPWPKIFYRPVCLVSITKVQWQHIFAINPPCCPASAIHFIGGIADLWVRHSSW